jgi:hypothetical protein
MCFRIRYPVNLNSLFTQFPTQAAVQKLILQLQQLQADQEILKSIELQNCKFYSDLIKKLIQYSRQFGSNLQGPTRELIKALKYERHFARNYYQSLFSGFMQFTLVTVMTWTFVYFVKLSIEIQFDTFWLLACGGLQLLGAIVYVLSFFVIYRIKLGHFSNAFYSLYTMRSLWGVGLPISLVVQKSEIGSIRKVSGMKFLLQRLETFTKLALSRGSSRHEDLDEMLEDLWMLHNDSFENFKRLLVGLKFIQLAVFYLPAYLMVVFALLSTLAV